MKEKKTVYKNASELYNEYVEIYFNQYKTLSVPKKESLVINIILRFILDLSNMPPLQVHEEEIKDRKRLNILTPRKRLTRLPMLLPQIKARNNSYK